MRRGPLLGAAQPLGGRNFMKIAPRGPGGVRPGVPRRAEFPRGAEISRRKPRGARSYGKREKKTRFSGFETGAPPLMAGRGADWATAPRVFLKVGRENFRGEIVFFIWDSPGRGAEKEDFFNLRVR